MRTITGRIFFLLLSLFLICSCEQSQDKPDQVLWYNYPAEHWNSQSLHLGNGFIGASFFGGADQEVFAMTEGSMWTGGPFQGNWEEYGVNPKALEYMDDIREAVVEGDFSLADSLTKTYYLGQNKHFGHFTSIGELVMKMEGHDQLYSGYRRSLNMDNSTGKVEYEMDGVHYSREYFCSYPDRVLVMKITADSPGRIGFSLGTKIMQENYHVKTSKNTYNVSGLIDGGDRKFSMIIRTIPYGGKSWMEDESIGVSEADSIVVLLSAGTDYKQEYPDYLGSDPEPECEKLLDKAAVKGYKALREDHIKDYRDLYTRVKLDLNSDPDLNKLPTNERWERFKKGEKDTGLKELVFNLGKYMIISSSRPGSLPANLQGKWNAFYKPPWTGNYQANINIQEIYWPCGPMDLLECQEPYVEWTKDLVNTGREIAERVYGTGGWISHTTGNIYGHAAPVGGIPWGVYPLAPVWHCQHLWEQYRFSMDTAYLKETAYPIIKEAVQFWLENLVEYKDYLIVAPSISAEHGPLSSENNSTGETGYTMPSYQDAEMIGDLFGMCEEASDILGCDQSFRDSVKNARQKLLPYRIGKYGQLQEWFEDIDSPEDHHRHIAHLYAVCPGSDIHPLITPELSEAAKKSLNMRGEGRYMDFEIAAGGNWAMCWRIWCWARLMDGNRANKIFNQMLTEEGFENLLTFQHAEYGMGREDLFHEPGPMYLHFQLDASASIPGFMAEMLLQSHLGEIILLPALPDEWPEGEITGIKARGGYTFDIHWKDKKLKKAVIYTQNGRLPQCRVGDKPVDIESDPRFHIVYQ